MVSKTSAVKSIRLPNEAWAWLATEAESRGTTVNALVALAVERLKPQAAKVPEVFDRKFDPPITMGAARTNLPETYRPAVQAGVVPLYERKGFNPQQKKGKK